MEFREKENICMGWETSFGDKRTEWTSVQIPHNWEDYQGYHRQSHGNLHGTAWYRKKLKIAELEANLHRFLYFEGVGSYADVYMNGDKVGDHAGGMTSFTIDVTKNTCAGENEILVRTSHPKQIKDLPWVCGGCFGTPNTEGSQPFGIFRPVSMYCTGHVRISPFGVWILPVDVATGKPRIRFRTEIENLEPKFVEGILKTVIMDADGSIIESMEIPFELRAQEKSTIEQYSAVIQKPRLWSTGDPHLYQAQSIVLTEGRMSDQVRNSFGLRFVEWENFRGVEERAVDPIKVRELPSEKNNYFSSYTRGGSDSAVRIIPGGIRVFLPENTSESTVIRLESTVENQDAEAHLISIESFVQTYNATKSIANLKTTIRLDGGERKTIIQETEKLSYLDPWSEENPVLHGVYTTIRGAEDSLKEYNQTYTSFGIFETDDLVNKGDAYVDQDDVEKSVKHRFLLNGQHVLINGTAEYQHMLGNDHAFSEEQISARVQQIQAAGFNAFREAHCPHALRYLELCEQYGILYWAQMGAHLYFDNKGFYDNFMILTEEFVRERRNSPSLILWGIQNESLLPTFFADNVRQLIRRLDDTASVERLVTTCNGGSGSDWNVPQNWSGTYGGKSQEYDKDIRRQLLVGEYGQYRVLGKHEEGDCEARQNMGGDVSEELFSYCLENKVRLAERVKDEIYGHFQWIFSTHANPGRETMFCLDGSGLDGVGVVNSKGLLTCWGEPVDAYYMYRSNYISAEKEPMVYIVSHTWPYRFRNGAQKADIHVYSNCDEVELFAGIEEWSYGKQKKGTIGNHFVFEGCYVEYNTISAVGYVNGVGVAHDCICLEYLKQSPGHHRWLDIQPELIMDQPGTYLYRINCGGEEYRDAYGNLWEADRPYQEGGHGFKSWAMEYPELDERLGSQRRTSDLISGTREQELFRSYRYGREKLKYILPVENGEYEVELYFMEPWYGKGGSMECTGWRLFDVAVNDSQIRNLDIWKESGGVNAALKKTVRLSVHDGKIQIGFPYIASYQAVICAIAVRRIP